MRYRTTTTTTAVVTLILGAFTMPNANATPLDTVTLGGKTYNIALDATGNLKATPADTTNTVDFTLTAGTTPGTALASWNAKLTDVVVSRDGTDINGTGAWTSSTIAGAGFTFTNLAPGQGYKFTFAGKLDGQAVTQIVSYTLPTPTTPAPTNPTPATPPATTGPNGLKTTTGTLPWISGASGPGIANGKFSTWRGLDVPMAATWSDNVTAAQTFGQLDKGAEYGAWTGSLNMAVGFGGSSKSWAQAAKGEADGDWRKSLTTLKAKWDKLPHQEGAALFIRFAHEANTAGSSSWYGWAWNSYSPDDVKATWKRYRSVMDSVFGKGNAYLVFSTNKNSVGLNRAWTDYWPGADVAQILDCDCYDSGAAWADEVNSVDKYGAPIGANPYLAKAKEWGVPFGMSEWGNRFNNWGDDPTWVQGVHDFYRKNAYGWAPGSALYEIKYEDVIGAGNFSLFANGGNTKGPKSAALYKQLW